MDNQNTNPTMPLNGQATPPSAPTTPISSGNLINQQSTALTAMPDPVAPAQTSNPTVEPVIEMPNHNVSIPAIDPSLDLTGSADSAPSVFEVPDSSPSIPELQDVSNIPPTTQSTEAENIALVPPTIVEPTINIAQISEPTTTPVAQTATPTMPMPSVDYSLATPDPDSMLSDMPLVETVAIPINDAIPDINAQAQEMTPPPAPTNMSQTFAQYPPVTSMQDANLVADTAHNPIPQQPINSNPAVPASSEAVQEKSESNEEAVEEAEQEAKQGAGKYKVRVIGNKCIGAASCVAVAPKAFKLNDQQIADVLDSINQENDENLLLAAQSCPTMAIEVIDTETGAKVWPK